MIPVSYTHLILPPDFQLIPRQVNAEKGYKADPGVLKQLKVIKEV